MSDKPIQTARARLATLRDEIRLKVHLASMDAKDRWHALEPEINRGVTELEHATEKTLDALIGKLQKFSDSLI